MIFQIPETKVESWHHLSQLWRQTKARTETTEPDSRHSLTNDFCQHRNEMFAKKQPPTSNNQTSNIFHSERAAGRGEVNKTENIQI